MIYNLPTIRFSNWAIRESASATIIRPISASWMLPPIASLSPCARSRLNPNVEVRRTKCHSQCDSNEPLVENQARP